MVPRVEFPPRIEFTDHATVLFAEFETVAENVNGAAARILAVVGATEIDTEPVGGLLPDPPEFEEVELEEQETRAIEARDTCTKNTSVRMIEDIMKIVLDGDRDGNTGR